ncbi:MULTISPECIES: hypothetical protein [unclassified Mesorhizobium]|uniref:hypothetical protein n=1 Tax=unclassified Mesorhizobium TaxID=325217 RepID=UPI00333DE359
MLQWLDGVAGPGYAAAILWTFAVLVLLLIILLIIRLIRSLTFGTFVAGGRNRKTRLAVMDATAVDSHRRLVLVRRDDIEHLLLIGGPTDVVVERDIRLSALRRPALTGDNGHQPAARSASTTAAPVRQAPPQPASVTATPVRARQTATMPATMPAPAPKPASNVTPLPSYGSVNASASRHAQPPARQDSPARYEPPAQHESIDDALMKELEVSLDEPRFSQTPSKPVAKASPSLDDEMTKLLGELSNQKR